MSHVTHEEVTEARDSWMSHITMPFRDLLASWDCEVSHIWNESHHIWRSHVRCEGAAESCHVWKSHVTYGWVTSRCPSAASSPPRIVQWVTCGMSHVTYERVTSHVNESRHIWMSHVTYERVTSHMNESRDIWMSHGVMLRIRSHVTYGWVTSLGI